MAPRTVWDFQPVMETISEIVAPSGVLSRSIMRALMIERLSTPEGATISEIVSITGWKSHTVRGAIAGALKKKMGLTILSEKDESRGRIYRIA